MGTLKDFFVRDKKNTTSAVASEAPAVEARVEVREKETQPVDILDAILSGKEVITAISTPYGEFQFKYPDGADHLRIAHRRAAYLGGHPDASFDNVRRVQFEQWATLDVLIASKPERFSKVESWADCPDQELVDNLYTRGAQFCQEIRHKIRSSRPGEFLE